MSYNNTKINFEEQKEREYSDSELDFISYAPDYYHIVNRKLVRK